MNRSSICAGILGALSVAAAARADVPHETFMPENNLNLQDCLACENSGGITQDQFMATIAKAKSIFGPIIEAQGGTFEIKALWTDSTVNASAIQLGSSWIVNMYGGLARRPEVTVDGFTMVLCHEIGHHLSGFPFHSGWASNEGQADYFAAHVCPALWWGNDSNEAAQAAIPESVKARCGEGWTSDTDLAVCARTALAAKSATGLLAALHGTTVDFNARDTNEVTSTMDGHPEPQCRLDTYIAAATCPLAWDNSVIPGKSNGTGDNSLTGEQDSAKYVCTMSSDYKYAQRPHCWFKPNI